MAKDHQPQHLPPSIDPSLLLSNPVKTLIEVLDERGRNEVSDAGSQTRIVGGAVRDLLMGRAIGGI